jgi:hypothetical protein
VRGCLADGKFAAACADAQVIALTDWTLYPHMTEVWRMLQSEVFSKLTRRPGFFIDLVDPSSRSAADIIGVAAIFRDFEPAGPVTLGLNGNEANILCRLHGLADVPSEVTPDGALRQAMSLRGLLGISQIVVHRIPFAVSASSEGGFIRSGPYCANPKKSTGAGDRFNAGFCLGQVLDLGDAASLALGCAAGGFFVRQARSANRQELVDFLRDWAAGTPDRP